MFIEFLCIYFVQECGPNKQLSHSLILKLKVHVSESNQFHDFFITVDNESKSYKFELFAISFKTNTLQQFLQHQSRNKHSRLEMQRRSSTFEIICCG